MTTLTIREVARELRIPRARAYALARKGTIPTIRLGRSVRVPRAALEALLAGAGGPTIPAAGGAWWRPEVPVIAGDCAPLPCPACGGHEVAVSDVDIVAGPRHLHVSCDGVEQRLGAPEGEGAVVRLALACEAGHRAVVRLAFSHGTTWARVESVDELFAEDGTPAAGNPIWRD